MPTIAGKDVTIDQIRGTLALLKYYRAFLASDRYRCKDPEQSPDFGWVMTKEDVRRRVAFLINVAINRKAGIPDVAGRKQDPDYQIALWRDCRRVRDRVNRRVVVRQFETAEIRRRYSHLLSD